jgi:hypothetical protein
MEQLDHGGLGDTKMDRRYTINVPGSPQDKDQGGVYIDNNEVPGMYRQLYLLSMLDHGGLGDTKMDRRYS